MHSRLAITLLMSYLLQSALKVKIIITSQIATTRRHRTFNLVNLTTGYEAEQWSIRAWARNVFDEEVPTRGFEFGNDPREGYATHTYTQLGEPMVAGVTFIYEL